MSDEIETTGRARKDLPADMERAHRRWKAEQSRKRAAEARARKANPPDPNVSAIVAGYGDGYGDYGFRGEG